MKNGEPAQWSLPPLSALALSVRASGGLRRLGIKTTEELVQRSGDDLMSARNFGETSLREVESRLRMLGLRLKGGCSEVAELLQEIVNHRQELVDLKTANLDALIQSGKSTMAAMAAVIQARIDLCEAKIRLAGIKKSRQPSANSLY